VIATPQKIEFSRQVKLRLLHLAALMKQRGIQPESAIPASMQQHYKATREMHARFFDILNPRTDYSHAEMVSEQKLAGWMINEWHRLHGTEAPDTGWNT
jgi:hypothetical protein